MQQECLPRKPNTRPVKSDMQSGRHTVYCVLHEKLVTGEHVNCVSRPATHMPLNFSRLSQSLPLNSDKCRQFFFSLVTAKMASHFTRGRKGLLRKLIKPVICDEQEVVSTIPHWMHCTHFRNHYMTEWLHPCTSVRRSLSNSSPKCKCSDTS